VQELLKKATDLSRDGILSEEVMLAGAQKTRSGVLVGGLLGVLITRSIVMPLRQGVAFAPRVWPRET